MSSPPKTVSFSEHSTDQQPPPVPSTSAETNATSQRRSSIKSGSIPLSPPLETYKHPDPLLRRLRLTDGNGNRVSLAQQFPADIKLVGFLFG